MHPLPRFISVFVFFRSSEKQKGFCFTCSASIQQCSACQGAMSLPAHWSSASSSDILISQSDSSFTFMAYFCMRGGKLGCVSTRGTLHFDRVTLSVIIFSWTSTLLEDTKPERRELIIFLLRDYYLRLHKTHFLLNFQHGWPTLHFHQFRLNSLVCGLSTFSMLASECLEQTCPRTWFAKLTVISQALWYKLHAVCWRVRVLLRQSVILAFFRCCVWCWIELQSKISCLWVRKRLKVLPGCI